MRRFATSLLCGALLLASTGLRAEDTCPAMSRLDAQQLLGSGEVTVNWRGGNDYTCRFKTDTAQLVIAVKPYRFQNGWASYVQQCIGASNPAQAIGDEAVACFAGDTSQVIGHVRDTLLDVRLTSASPERDDRVHKAAMIVAGNIR